MNRTPSARRVARRAQRRVSSRRLQLRLPFGAALACAAALLCQPLPSFSQSAYSGGMAGGAPAARDDAGRSAASGTIDDATRSAGAIMSGKTGAAASTEATGTAAALSMADRRFATRAAESDLFELRSSELAVQKASSDAVRRFAQQMIDDHRKTSDRLGQLASARGMTPPTELDQAHAVRLSRLEKLSGAAFDREYMRMQRTSHRDALALFERQARRGQDAELKRFAADTLPALRGHVQLAGDVTSQVARGGTERSDTTASASPTGTDAMSSGSAATQSPSQVASAGARSGSAATDAMRPSGGASTGTGGSAGGSTSNLIDGAAAGSTSTGTTGAASGASR